MSNQVPIYSQVLPKNQQNARSSKQSSSHHRAYSSLRGDPRNQPPIARNSDANPINQPGFDPLNYNHGGNFHHANQYPEKNASGQSHRKSGAVPSSRRTPHRGDANEGKVEAYLRQNQMSIKQHQMKHCSAVKQAEHRVNLRSLPLGDSQFSRANPPFQDRTPPDGCCPFPGRDAAQPRSNREHTREREGLYDIKENFIDPPSPRCQIPGQNPSNDELYHRQVKKSSSFRQSASTTIIGDKRKFFCREWAFQKIAHCLEQRPVSKTCGALILGDAGSGKTALCRELSTPGTGPAARQQRALSRRMIARHFLQSQNENSLTMAEFIRTIVMQILNHSTQHQQFLMKTTASSNHLGPTTPGYLSSGHAESPNGERFLQTRVNTVAFKADTMNKIYPKDHSTKGKSKQADVNKDSSPDVKLEDDQLVMRNAHRGEERDMEKRLDEIDLGEDQNDESSRQCDETDHYSPSHRSHNTMDRIYEKDLYDDLLAPVPRSGHKYEDILADAGPGGEAMFDVDDSFESIGMIPHDALVPLTTCPKDTKMKLIADDSLDYKLYENHENLFLRNESQRHSKEIRVSRVVRQNSEPVSRSRPSQVQKSLSTDTQNPTDGSKSPELQPSERGDDVSRRQECEYAEARHSKGQNERVSRIPIANFKYPNRNVPSVENSPSKRHAGDVRGHANEPPLHSPHLPVDEEELPEYQNVFKPSDKNSTHPSRSPCERLLENDILKVLRHPFLDVQEEEDVPPPIPSLPVSPRTLIANSYYEKLLGEPEIQQSLLPHNLEKNPDDCFKKALLFPLLEIDPPKQCLFILVDSVDEGALTGPPLSVLSATLSKEQEQKSEDSQLIPGRSLTVSRTVAELLANHHHLFPQWLLLVCTARKQSKCLTRMFTGFRKISLDSLHKAHVSADVQRYMVARLDASPRLRARLAGPQGAPQHTEATVKALEHLRIKSDGCLLYLEKVLDGVADGFIALREIKVIPGTLNGLYLWLCQRLFHGRRFSKVRPLLDVLLVAKCGVTESMLYACILTTNYTITREDFAKRLHLLRRILVLDHTTGCLSLFHPSFGAWLLDVKHCTRKFQCSPADGHAALSMYYTLEAKRLTALEIHNYVLHMTRLEQHLLAQRKSHANELSSKASPGDQSHRSPTQPESSDLMPALRNEATDSMSSEIDLHTVILLWIIDSGCNIETSLRKEDSFGKELNGLAAIQEHMEGDGDIARLDFASTKTPSISTFSEAANESMPRLNSHHSLGGTSVATATTTATPNTTVQSDPLPEFLTNFYWPTLPRDSRVLRALLEMGAQVEAGPLLPLTGEENDRIEEGLPEEAFEGDAKCNEESIHLIADITASQLSLERQLVSEARRPSEDETEELSDLRCLQSPAPQVDPITGRSIVHELAQRGEVAMLKIVLERWPDLVDSMDSRGSTALANCARRSGVEATKALLAAGADADRADADGWTPLRAAAWGGHTEIVEVLLRHGCDVDCIDSDSRTALRAASWSGHTACVELLIAAGADVSRPDAEGRTSLIAAAYMGHADIVSLLLEAGADYDHADEDGRTALSVAALCAGGIASAGPVPQDGAEGCVKVVQLLLEKGADPRIADKEGATPLIVAAFEGHKEICELLLEYDAELDASDAAGRTALWAAAGAGHASATATLLFWGACIDTVDQEGRTVLSIAAAQGSVDVVRQLLDRGLDEQHRDNAGWTPLHYATFEGHMDVCEALLEAGSKVDECDNDGKGALMLAAQEGHVRLVELLVREWDAPVDQRAHDGKTSLRLAALEGHGGCVKTLIGLGANVDAVDADGRSITYVLCLDDRLAMAKYMIQRCGADVEIADTEGRTPLHVSAWQGHQEMVNLLLSVGANPDARDADLRTALHSAAWRGRAGIVRALLAAGATVAPVCRQGATPLGIAAQEGHEECVLWLLQHGADPRQPDHCGRTPARVASRAGHTHICALLESWPRSPQPPQNQALLTQPSSSNLDPDQEHSPTNTSGSTAETKQCTSSLMNSRLSPTPLAGVLNQSSPDSKRRSVHSSNSTKSSSNLTTTSTKSSQQELNAQLLVVPSSSSVAPSAPPASHVSNRHNDVGKASRANLALSFAQQVAKCSRGAIGGWRHRSRDKDSNRDSGSFAVNEKDNYIVQSSRSYMQSERDADMIRKEAFNGYERDGMMSPLYASPPHSPISDVCSPTQPNLPAFGQPNNVVSNPTDNHFNRDTHMRIILGRDNKNSPPADNREGSKSKRNGIVTNPALRLVANMKNGLDNAAANLRRTGVALAASASSANPAVKTNAFQWRRETPL